MSRADTRCPTGKICYPVRDWARRQARRLRSKGHGDQRAYLCGLCDYYHVGHALALEREWQRDRNRGIRA